jgi:hypothetical protein
MMVKIPEHAAPFIDLLFVCKWRMKHFLQQPLPTAGTYLVKKAVDGIWFKLTQKIQRDQKTYFSPSP